MTTLSLCLFDFSGCSRFRKLQQDSYFDEVSGCFGMCGIFISVFLYLNFKLYDVKLGFGSIICSQE